MSKNFSESYDKTNKAKDTNKSSLLPFIVVAILFNTRLTKFVRLPETISKGLLCSRLQNGYHTLFDGIYIRKTHTFDGRLQAGKQERVRGRQIRNWRKRIALSAEALSWSSIHFPVLCNSQRTRRIRCSNWFKTAW